MSVLKLQPVYIKTCLIYGRSFSAVYVPLVRVCVCVPVDFMYFDEGGQGERGGGLWYISTTQD